MTGSARRRIGLLGVIAIAIALVACGDSAVPETKDGKVTVEGSGKKATVTVEGEHGATITFNEQKVPAAFPRDVPLPQGATLQSATSGTRAGEQYFRLSYTLGSASARASLDAYATRLTDAGFTVEGTGAAGTTAIPSPLQAEGKGRQVLAIATGGGPGPGALTITVTGA